MKSPARCLRVIGPLLAALVLVACGSTNPIGAGGAPLQGDEIRTLLAGNSVTGDNWDGPFTVYFDGSGEMRGLRSNHYKDKGAWRTEEEAFCAKWDNWWGSVERCFGIYLDGDSITWVRPDSDAPDPAKVVQGNPRAL